MLMSLEQALQKVAADMVELAWEIHEEDAYASHVTEEEKKAALQKRLLYAHEVREGKHTTNFTIWQRVRAYTHGDCPAMLP